MVRLCDITLRCITDDKEFLYNDDPISEYEIPGLICEICNDRPLDYGNFHIEPLVTRDEPIVSLEDVIREIEKEPDHYRAHGLSPLSAFKRGLLSKEELGGFIKGNIIKYTIRAGKKDDALKDINKAIDYLNHLKELYV